MDHDHLPALSALLFSAPLAVLALTALQLAAGGGYRPARRALERAATASPGVKFAALLLMVGGAIHLGLVPAHLDEPILAASFAAAGVGLVALAAAALLRLSRWRPLAVAALVGVLAAYSVTRLAGLESVDVLGVATAGLELGALGLVVRARRTDREGPGIWETSGPFHRDSTAGSIRGRGGRSAWKSS